MGQEFKVWKYQYKTIQISCPEQCLAYSEQSINVRGTKKYSNGIPVLITYQSKLIPHQVHYQVNHQAVTMFKEKVKFSSVAQSCLTLCGPMNCSMPGLPVHYQLPESKLKPMSIESVKPSNHLILCHPLFLLPSIFPSIRVFSNESALHIRCPKYWSFSFNISPSNEYQGLISF